jgi:lysozyme family protein
VAQSSYDEALRRVLAHEGGYSNHSSDPGGPTNFGITIGDYRRYVNANATASDVRAMRAEEAKAIYRQRYWDAMRCDELPPGLDYAVFDYGVNSGIGRAVKVLQRLLGLVDNGRLSEAVVVAAAGHDAAVLVGRLCDERLAFLKRLKTWPVFGAGWGRRVAEVRAAALVMAAAARSGNKPAPAAAAGARIPKGSVAVIAAAGAATAYQAGVRPAIVAGIALALLALACAGWLGWRWRQRRLASH